MNAQILIKTADDWFEFTTSKTGQLDFEGKWIKDAAPDVKDAQEIASSTYYTPSFYLFVNSKLNFNPVLYVAPDVDVSDTDVFDYLIHIGPVLAAVEAKDSLLAGELYLRRKNVFDRFSKLTSYIMEGLCVEIIFSCCFGRLVNVNTNDFGALFDSAQKKIEYNPASETFEQGLIRWFKMNKCTLTLPLVGTQFYSWDAYSNLLSKLTDNLSADTMMNDIEKIRKAKHDFYESLKVTVQAEPYNSHDKNSILVCIENPEEKIFGNPGLEKAGHIRAAAAEILRTAKKEKMSYKAELSQISAKDIVVKIEV